MHSPLTTVNPGVQDGTGTYGVKLTPGLYVGHVIGVMLPNNRVKVRLEGSGSSVDCQVVSSIFSSLLGFQTSYVPAVNTRVLVFFHSALDSYLMGGVPDIRADPQATRAALDPRAEPYAKLQTFTSQRPEKEPQHNSHKAPVDLVEGEVQIDNLLGVGLTLLRHLASLQAGDLARVECLLLDDMVRIISDTFKHHTAFGDFRIYNDGGKLNCVWDGTSHDFEAWGLTEPGNPRVKVEGDAVNLGETGGVDGFKDDGRWRFSQYVGWLGNFIHLFVTDPTQELGKFAANQFRSGRARLHVHVDGSVLVQSVTEIVLEKVVCIPVPVPRRRPDDPEGNRSDAGIDPPPPKWTPNPGDSVFETVFQLRDYARWLANSHGLCRFHQMPRDWQVPSEAETPTPMGNSQKFEQTSQANPAFELKYACFRIYRDGSVQTVDAYGNSFTSTKTGIQISSTQDILLEAAGSINLVAGRDVNVTARQNVTISALFGTMRLYALLKLRIAAESCSMILKGTAGLFLEALQFTVGDGFQIDESGNVNVMGGLTAQRVSASFTAFYDDHIGHVIPGVPAVIPSTDKDLAVFTFPTSYGVSVVYKTYSQQALQRGEQFSLGLFTPITPAGNVWPGDASVVDFPSPSNLSTVITTAIPPNAPGPRVVEPASWNYQL